MCRECRTAYGAGEACDAGDKHRVVSMSHALDREVLITEVWGAPSSRRRVREMAKAGGSGAGIGGALEGCNACACEGADLSGCGEAAGGGGEIMAVIAVIVVAAIAFIAIYYATKWIVGYIRKRRNRPKPKGALTRPAKAGQRTGYVGRVVADTTLVDPITGRPCVAYGIKLRSNRFLSGDITLRDAATIGFDVQLDSGDIVRIPAGRIALNMHGAGKLSDDETIKSSINAHIELIDPHHSKSSVRAVPWDRAHLRLIELGARVELRGDIARAPDPDAAKGPSGYREAAASILVPSGVPQLVLIE